MAATVGDSGRACRGIVEGARIVGATRLRDCPPVMEVLGHSQISLTQPDQPHHEHVRPRDAGVGALGGRADGRADRDRSSGRPQPGGQTQEVPTDQAGGGLISRDEEEEECYRRSATMYEAEMSPKRAADPPTAAELRLDRGRPGWMPSRRRLDRASTSKPRRRNSSPGANASPPPAFTPRRRWRAPATSMAAAVRSQASPVRSRCTPGAAGRGLPVTRQSRSMR